MTYTQSVELLSLEMMKSETLCVCDCRIKCLGGIDSWQHSIKNPQEEEDEEDGLKKLGLAYGVAGAEGVKLCVCV